MPSSKIPGAATEAPWPPSTGRVVAVLSSVVPPGAPPSTRILADAKRGQGGSLVLTGGPQLTPVLEWGSSQSRLDVEPGRVGGHVHDAAFSTQRVCSTTVGAI